MNDDYRRAFFNDYCPVCNGALTCCGEVRRLFPPGVVAELFICDEGHKWMLDDGILVEANV